eukprot:g1438.t1
MSSVAFVAPQASLAKLEATSDYSRYQNRAGKSAFVGGYDEGENTVNQALTSMAAMFVVAGGVRWRERRQRVTLRRAGGGPSTAELVDKSEYLRDQHWTKTFHASFMGGAYVGMAGLLSLVIGGNMASKFITQKAVFAALFPINLLLVLTTGGQLFTGNSATMAIGVYEKKCKVKDHSYLLQLMSSLQTMPVEDQPITALSRAPTLFSSRKHSSDSSLISHRRFGDFGDF